jgi:hypothetical protein
MATFIEETPEMSVPEFFPSSCAQPKTVELRQSSCQAPRSLTCLLKSRCSVLLPAPCQAPDMLSKSGLQASSSVSANENGRARISDYGQTTLTRNEADFSLEPMFFYQPITSTRARSQKGCLEREAHPDNPLMVVLVEPRHGDLHTSAKRKMELPGPVESCPAPVPGSGKLPSFRPACRPTRT